MTQLFLLRYEYKTFLKQMVACKAGDFGRVFTPWRSETMLKCREF